MITPGLDRLTRLQRQPFGTNTATNPNVRGGTTGSQLRRLGEDYNQATRLLRRQARRGDEQSALGAIKLREAALAQGIQTGGIRKHDEYQSDILGRVDAMEKGAVDRERAAQLDRLKTEEELQEAERVSGTDAPVVPEGGLRQPEPAATTVIDPRTGAALDILGGVQSDDDVMAQRGLDEARRLGIKDPTSVLRGDANLRFRKTLDGALGKAKTPAEVAALRQRGTNYGVAPADFDRRANWWEKNRKI